MSSEAPKHVCGSGPIQDGRFIAAQVISILAVLLSFPWWLTLLLWFLVFGSLQVAWCCKLDRKGTQVVAIGALLASATAVVGAVFSIADWRNFKGDWSCPVFYVFGNKNPDDLDHFTYEEGSGINRFDGCNEVAFTILFSVVALLWFLVGFFLMRYLQCSDDTADDVEMPETAAVEKK